VQPRDGIIIACRANAAHWCTLVGKSRQDFVQDFMLSLNIRCLEQGPSEHEFPGEMSAFVFSKGPFRIVNQDLTVAFPVAIVWRGKCESAGPPFFTSPAKCPR
jgi:hypothetical protein